MSLSCAVWCRRRHTGGIIPHRPFSSFPISHSFKLPLGSRIGLSHPSVPSSTPQTMRSAARSLFSAAQRSGNRGFVVQQRGFLASRPLLSKTYFAESHEWIRVEDDGKTGKQGVTNLIMDGLLLIEITLFPPLQPPSASPISLKRSWETSSTSICPNPLMKSLLEIASRPLSVVTGRLWER